MDTRKKILKGARDYIKRFGQAEFTVRAVAKHAGVNHGLVHHYFGSKENLILELIDEVDNSFHEVLKKNLINLGQLGYKETVENSFVKSDMPRLMIAFIGFSQTIPEVAKRISRLIDDRKKLFQQVFALENPLDSAIILAAIQGMALQHSIAEDFPLKESIERIFTIFSGNPS